MAKYALFGVDRECLLFEKINWLHINWYAYGRANASTSAFRDSPFAKTAEMV